MKLLIATLVVCAVLAQHIDCYRYGGREWATDMDAFDYNDQNQRQLRQQRDQENESDVADLLGLVEQQHQQQQAGSGAADNGQALSLPGAAALLRKITERLDNSPILSVRRDVREKLMKYANARLNDCKTVGGDALDKHCVSRLTGLIMHLIGSMEGMVHKLAGN